MPESSQSIRSRIRGELEKYLPENVAPGTLGDDDALITAGLLDSVAALSVVDSLEEAYGVKFESEDLTLEHIDTIALLAERVQARLASAGGGG